MPHRLDASDRDFARAFADFLAAPRAAEAEVAGDVAAIIAEVRAGGLDAALRLTRRFDDPEATAETLVVGEDELAAAVASTPPEHAEALEIAAARIEAYHRRQTPRDERWTDDDGVELGWRWTPVDAAGLYAPGGLASYPSSVLMNAIPARVAGVPRLALCAPAPGGALNPLVLYAAHLAGVREIYRIGGAQAIAALAYGAGPIAPVDVVVGPGNAFVAEAKRQVFGRVGIDSVAGPSEVLIIADKDNDPSWLAADLLAQAEHDPTAQSILITDDAGVADAVATAVARRLETLPKAEIAGASWEAHGAIILVPALGDAIALANEIAPEHLQLCVGDADVEAFAAEIRHAGAIFLGRDTPEALGDYVAGPNHVLPTARAARHASGLSVLNFMKRTTIARATPAAVAAIGPAAETLARAETLDAHALSVALRREARR